MTSAPPAEPAADTAAPTPGARVRRLPSGRRVADVLLALGAHVAVGLAWLVTAAATMGSLGVVRRMAINSEFAWDTGRLPQPWVIPLGLAAVLAAHAFFRWAMRRAGRGTAAWGPSVVAWCGVLLGVLLGAYLWIPPVQVGVKVGPAAGVMTPWGPLGWIAHHSRLALPALVGFVTAALLLLSPDSPLLAGWRWLRPRLGRLWDRLRRLRPRRRPTAA